MDDLAAACRVFMNEFWRGFETGDTVERSGYIVGGVDIADAVKAVIDATRKECAEQALQINDDISQRIER